MNDMLVTLDRWQLDIKAVREHLYRAPTPRERERWHAIWLLARGWSAAQVAEALGRDAHTIGDWAEDLRQKGPAGLAVEQAGGSPPPSTRRNRLS
jgi:transposase